jgi:type 1 glutamine amidotransferase
MKVSHPLRRFTLLACAVFGLAPAQGAEPPRKPRVFFLIGESEHQTAVSLPAFTKAELEPLGIQSTFSIQTDESSEVLPNLDSLAGADLLFISARRKHPSAEQMELIRTFIAAGKPVAGIRSASHAFGKRKGETDGAWDTFDKEILGATYGGHYDVGGASLVKPLPDALRHPILTGIDATEFRYSSHLYKNALLAPTVTPLLQGRLESDPAQEPVAWINTLGKQRVFYTSLGSSEDFKVPQFRRLLLNGITWALGLTVPPDQAPPTPATTVLQP